MGHKVLHIVESLNRDGTSFVLKSIVDGERKDVEHHVAILTDNYDESFIRQWFNASTFHYLDLSLDHRYRLRDYFRHWINYSILSREKVKGLSDIVLSLKPNIVHFHTHPRELLLRHSIPGNCKIVYTDHGVRLKSGQYSLFNMHGLAWVYRRFYKGVDLIAVSKQVWECHQRFSFASGKRIHVCIENGVDTTVYSPGSDDNPHCIYLSRFDPVKRHNVLLNAWASLPQLNDVHLLLVGDGALLEESKELAHDLNSKNEVEFTGNVHNPAEQLRRCCIGVFPSSREGLPLALLEMMSSGLAVVVSDIPELTSIIDDGETGLHFTTDDPESLAKSILKLVNDKELRTRLGQNARSLVIKNYSVEKMVKKYHEVYDLI